MLVVLDVAPIWISALHNELVASLPSGGDKITRDHLKVRQVWKLGLSRKIGHSEGFPGDFSRNGEAPFELPIFHVVWPNPSRVQKRGKTKSAS